MATPEEIAAAEAKAKDTADAEAKATADAKAESDKKAQDNVADDGKGKSVDELLAALEELKATNKSLDDEKAELLKDTMKNKERYKTAKTGQATADEKLSTVTTQIKELFGDDVSLDDLQVHVQKRKEKEASQLRNAGEFDKLQERMKAEHKKEIDVLNGKLGALTKEKDAVIASQESSIRELLVSNQFGQSSYITDDLVLTARQSEKLYGQHFRVDTSEDGKREMRAYLGDEPLTDAEGKFYSFDAALKAIIAADPEKDALLKNKAHDGAGSHARGKETDSQDNKAADVSGASRIEKALAAQRK